MAKFIKAALKNGFMGAGKGHFRHKKKKALMMRHTFEDTVTFFKAGSESNPIYTVNRSGSHKVTVVKAIAVTVLIITGVILAAVAVKMLVNRAARKKLQGYDGFEYEYTDADELPF